ncbi:MAG: SLBB domain-containing protein [Fimbriimonadaceae bacterium]|nr:SLBB domain-containing protein [Fimbriimonadaceae bacterium]
MRRFLRFLTSRPDMAPRTETAPDRREGQLRALLLTAIGAAVILGGSIQTRAEANQSTGSTTGTTAAPQTTGTGTTGTTSTGTTSTGTTSTGTTAAPQTTGTGTNGMGTAGTATASTSTTGTNGTATTGAATTTGTAATTGGAVTPPANTPVVEPASTPTVAALPIFGLDYFAEARALILARRKGATGGSANALESAVGPEALLSGRVATSIPAKYQLGPGDTLSVRISSPVQAATSQDLKIDGTGAIIVPGTTQRVILRGQTLAQATDSIRAVTRRYLRDAAVELSLSELRTISIRVLGEAIAPGTYEVPSIITVFNALYAAGGPTDNGSFRNVELRRPGMAIKRLDLYRLLLKGDPSLDVAMQPGDTLFIPPAENRVAVKGEVKRPAVYELRTGESLRDALAYAGGARVTGVTQQVAVESVRPGQSRVLIDANLFGSNKSNNPVLYDGDTVEIFSIRDLLTNVVTVEGAVDQPRTFAHSRGMRVADLVTLARGLTANAYTPRADLYRKNPDGSLTLIPINLADALKRSANDNVEIKVEDRLKVYTIEEATFLNPRRIQLAGEVQRPGNYVRANGMTIRDLLIQGGGLKPTANDRVGLLQRFTPDGQPADLVKVNLAKAAAGDPAENYALQDNDILTVNAITFTEYVPEQTVEIVGAVTKPGVYTLFKDMRVTDLLFLAGATLPDASLARTYLQRTNPNGTQGPLVVVDLEKLRGGDTSQNVRLQPKDKLTIFKESEVQFRGPETVTISGAFLRPGTYPKSDKMTLRDVIDLAGGVLPTAAESLELVRAWEQVGTPVTRVRVADALAGDPRANLDLRSGDTITLPNRSDLRERPRIVFIQGAVKYPGPYMLTGANDRLSNLVSRAGGMTERAFPLAAEFARDPRNLSTPKQQNLQPRLAATLQLVAEDEYKRANALADLDRLRIVFSQGASISGGGGVQQILPQGGVVASRDITPGQSLDQALAQALSSEAASKARTLKESEIVPTGNLDVNLDLALRRPNSKEDVVLQDGDIITIPERPTTVAISGAVVLPSAIVWVPGKPLEYYLERSGGLTNDASISEILVIRASGAVVRYKKGLRIEVGDNVLVPTKVMAVRLRERQNDLQTITQTVSSAAISFALIRALTR